MPDLTQSLSLWLWQFDQTSEGNIEAIAATALQYANAPIVLVKAMDGPYFMGPSPQGDTSPEAISGYAKMAETIARGADAGITVIPWVNVLASSNAAAHAALGPALVVDAEPYASFFENGQVGPNTPADFTAYLIGLRAGGVQQLYISIDPRPWAEQALGVPNWASLVDGILPQMYWTDFQTAPDSAAMQDYVHAMALLGVPVMPVLPANGQAGDMARFAAICAPYGFTGFSLWRLGEADAAHLQEFSAMQQQAPPPDPTPDPPPDPNYAAQIADLNKRTTLLESELYRLNDVLVKRFAAIGVAVDPAHVPGE